MNCKEFSKYIGDYVNRTLSEEVAASAEEHLSACVQCASLARELERTSHLVRSLERVCAPAGFEERLKARLASQGVPSGAAGVGSAARRWLAAIGRAFIGMPARGHRLALRPVLAGIVLCAIIAGSVFMLGRGRPSDARAMDWGYIETCQEQHASFAVANPLADESAVILSERVRESNL